MGKQASLAPLEEMHSPLWWLAPPPCPVGSMSLDSRVAGLPYESSSFATPTSRGHYKAPLCCERLMKGMLRGVLFFPLNRGKSGAARIGGGERSEPVSRMVILPYDTESKSRNADFISIARRAIHNPRPKGPSNLRTFRTLGAQPRQPSHRRCVQ